MIGYVPENPVFGLESRHLGLVTPQEIGEIRERLEEAGRILSETVELDWPAEDRCTVFGGNAGGLVQ